VRPEGASRLGYVRLPPELLLAELTRRRAEFRVERSFDQDLSLEVLAVVGKMAPHAPERFVVELDAFIKNHREKLEKLFEAYRDDTLDTGYFVFQPEALLIFKLLEEDPFVLAEVWCASLPEEGLEKLATAWGVFAV
jgi:hypothetical protein